MKKISILILLALIAFGRTAWAQDEWPKTWISGSTTCTLTADSVFTVTPTNGVSGAMADYAVENQNNAPWYQDYCSINAVVISNGVTHVGNQSFYSVYAFLIDIHYDSRIKSVTFSNDVESIGDAAFFGCKLQTITIPDHVVTIGTRAFGSCNNASSIHIGNGVTTLGSNAFANCDDVQNLYIGQSVTTLGENCFHWSCYNAEIECHAAPFETWVSSDEDFTASAEDRGRFHVAFADYSAWKAAYPSTGCVIMPDLDTEIHWTSGNCELNLDGYGTLTISGNGAMADYTTTDCPWNNADIISKVNRVIVEDGVTTLSDNGFTGFTNVTDVVFLGDVLAAWPSCATDFASTAKCFVSYEWTGHYTNALAQFYFNCGYGLDWDLDTSGTLTISKTMPGSGLFYDYQNAEELPWHDRVSEISDVVLGDGVLDIGSYVFSGIHASTITIAESVTHIKGHAFDGSPTQFFIVPTSVTQIDAYAFANSGLYTFEIPSFMTQIPEGLFKDCQDLTHVTFNEGVTSIGKNAFFNSGLTEVDLPSTLTTIGANAFKDCIEARDIYCGITNPNVLTWTSYQTDFNQNADFHVFSGSLSQWQSRFPNALVNFVEDGYGPDNPFEIYTSADWVTFCNMVETISTGISAKLMADIDLGNLDNMVGTENKKFSGTFDGNGHSITLFVNDLDCKYFTYGSICRYLLEKAPFMYIQGATIKNLHILGSMETGQVDYTEWTVEEQSNFGSEYTSGLVSHASGNNYISNCHSGLQFVIYHHTKNDFLSGDHSGLFVGEVASGSTTTITNCLFDGVIDWGRSIDTKPKPSKNGGFVGCNRGTVIIANSLFAPSAVGFDNDDANYTFVCNEDDGSHQLYDCYYTRKFDNVQGNSASGWSQWHLSASLGSEWTLDRYSTAMPVMAEHELTGQGTLDDPYLIADADDWAYLARTVNGILDSYSDKYIKMTGDISTNIPVGFLASNRPFCGHFDGDGHTLNVDITFSDEYTAPFGCISGATIEGLVVTGAVRGGNHSAGLVGTVATDSGSNYIQDCKVLTAVITTGNYAGGIMGDGSDIYNYIIGCRFDGSITKATGTGSYAGALMGWCDEDTYGSRQHIEGCFVTGALSNFSHMGMNYHDKPKVFGGTNCYHLLDPDYYNEAPHAYSITSGTQGMTLANQESIPSYVYNPVSGINFYNHGMTVDGVLYGGPGESFCLALTAPDGFTYSNPMANGTAITLGYSGELYGYNVAINSSSPVDVVVTATLTLTGDPIHEINTVDDWNLFAFTVSNGCHNYSGETVNLNADLSVTEMVGRSGTNSFQGTFEGNEHTLTFNANTSEQLCAPFRWIKNATIKNLYTTGTIETSNQMAAGIVGRAFGNCSLIDCRSNMEIVSSKNGDGTHGGLVAVVNHEGGDPSNISLMTFEGCLFDGKLLTTNGTTNSGGFVGYSHSNRVQFYDCMFNPVEVTASMGAATFGRSADANANYTFDNAYYFTAFGTVQGKLAHSINAGENVSVEIDGSGTVYAVSGITAYGTGIQFLNNSTIQQLNNSTIYAGNGEEVSLNLSCTPPTGYACHHYETSAGTFSGDNNPYALTMPDEDVTVSIVTVEEWEGDGSAATPYLIATTDQWDLLAHRVNGTYGQTQNSYFGEYFKLTDNIIVSTMVGADDSHAFSGIFDGDGNTLTFNYTATANYTAPFRYVDGATVMNLIVDGTITTSYQFTAGFMSYVKGTTAITNCRSSITINSSVNGDGTHGSFLGNIQGGATTIEGCVFDGSLLGSNTNDWGGFVGWTDNRWENSTITILNSLFAPTAISANDGSTFTRYYTDYNPEYITITNCYYTQALGTPQGKLIRSITAGEYVTVAFAGNVTEYNVSGIATNGTGVQFLNNSTIQQFNNSTIYAGNEDIVSLTLNSDVPTGYVLDNFIATAGELEGTDNPYTLTMEDADVVINATIHVPDWTGTGTEDDPYIILYYTQLDLLAQRVNYGNQYQNTFFKLGADIAYDPNTLTNGSNFTAIGTYDNTFRGHFDGDNHTISGIRLVKNADYQGLFGMILGGEVKNLVLDDTDITGGSYTGGIVGYNQGGTITNCHVTSTVTIRTDQTNVSYHGGIVGQNYGNTTHCTSSATLTIENGNSGCINYGGIVGCHEGGNVTDNFVVGATIAQPSNYYGCIYGRRNTSYGILQRNYYNSCTMAGTAYNDVIANDGSVYGYTLDLGEYVTSTATVFTVPAHCETSEASYHVASHGTTITLGNTLPAGYVFDYYTVHGEAIEGNTFAVPNYDSVSVEVVFHVGDSVVSRVIPGYTGSNGGYVLLASPVGTVNPEVVTNMLDNEFDLYRFNQAADLEWENWKSETADHNHFDLEPGRGYLYANSEDVTLVFPGTPYTGTGEVTLSKADNASADFQGWNLVGNPFNENAYLEGDRDFYTMNPIGTEIIPVGSDARHIEAMEGIFVIANYDGETLIFTTTEPESTGNGKSMLALNLSQGHGPSTGSGATVIDRAVVRFSESDKLPKLQLFRNSTKVYIPIDGQDYAVVNAERAGEMPVNFKAKENGAYTLILSSEEVAFSYLHLIDNMTGNDVDMLANSSYTFEARTTDYESRFKLVFATKDGSSTGSETFAFYSNGSWIISNEGEATLQVIDLNGRILCNETVNGSVSKAINAAPGVYVIRLINGDNVKTQKIVIQ